MRSRMHVDHTRRIYVIIIRLCVSYVYTVCYIKLHVSLSDYSTPCSFQKERGAYVCHASRIGVIKRANEIVKSEYTHVRNR
jgi:hypothetical protein